MNKIYKGGNVEEEKLNQREQSLSCRKSTGRARERETLKKKRRGQDEKKCLR